MTIYKAETKPVDRIREVMAPIEITSSRGCRPLGSLAEAMVKIDIAAETTSAAEGFFHGYKTTSASAHDQATSSESELHTAAINCQSHFSTQYTETETRKILEYMIKIHNENCIDRNNEINILKQATEPDDQDYIKFVSTYPKLSEIIKNLVFSFNEVDIAKLAWLTGSFRIFEEITVTDRFMFPQRIAGLKIFTELFSKYGTEGTIKILSELFSYIIKEPEIIEWSMYFHENMKGVEIIKPVSEFSNNRIFEAIVTELINKNKPSDNHSAYDIIVLLERLDRHKHFNLKSYESKIKSKWRHKEEIVAIAVFNHFFTAQNGKLEDIYTTLSICGYTDILGNLLKCFENPSNSLSSGSPVPTTSTPKPSSRKISHYYNRQRKKRNMNALEKLQCGYSHGIVKDKNDFCNSVHSERGGRRWEPPDFDKLSPNEVWRW